MSAHLLTQCCGSMTFWCRSGSADPCLWLMNPDPDPAIFIIDLQDANKKVFKKNLSAFYLLKLHLHHFSKIKSQKEVTKLEKSRFFLLFLFNDRRIRIRIQSRIRIHTSDYWIRIRIQEAQKQVDPVDPDPVPETNETRGSCPSIRTCFIRSCL